MNISWIFVNFSKTNRAIWPFLSDLNFAQFAVSYFEFSSFFIEYSLNGRPIYENVLNATFTSDLELNITNSSQLRSSGVCMRLSYICSKNIMHACMYHLLVNIQKGWGEDKWRSNLMVSSLDTVSLDWMNLFEWSCII